MTPIPSAVIAEKEGRFRCECGNPAEHEPGTDNPEPGKRCWTEPEQRPDGTRRLFPSLPDGYEPPLPDETQIKAAAGRYASDLDRKASEFASARTPAGNPFDVDRPPDRDDYTTFREWRNDVFKWRTLRTWAVRKQELEAAAGR